MADTIQILKDKLDLALGEENRINRDIKQLKSDLKAGKENIQKLKAKINKAEGNCYYVYIVFVNGVPKYVGKGQGNRFKHPVSGVSSVQELNRDFFKGHDIEVRLLFGSRNMSENQALLYERNCIGTISSLYDIYNRVLPKEDEYEHMDCDFYELTEFIINNK